MNRVMHSLMETYGFGNWLGRQNENAELENRLTLTGGALHWFTRRTTVRYG